MHPFTLAPLGPLPPWAALAVGATIKGSALLLFAGVGAVFLRRAPAATRHLVWALALGGVLVLPALSGLVPAVRLAVVPAGWVSRSDAAPASSGAASVRISSSSGVPALAPREDSPLETAAPHAELPDEPSAQLPTSPLAGEWRARVAAALSAMRPATLGGWVLLVWALGFAAVLMRLLIGVGAVRRLASHASPVTDPTLLTRAEVLAQRMGIARRVTVVSARGGVVPMTWGVLRPVILLPADAAAWDGERQRIVLLHELAHVRRLDALWQGIAGLVAALYWFNPLVWLAARRLRAERERACDDCVLAVGTRASVYAQGLLDIARTLSGARSPAYPALCMARRSDFEGRLLAILEPGRHRRTAGRAGAASVGALAALIILPIAALRPSAAAALHAAPLRVARVPHALAAAVVDAPPRQAPAPAATHPVVHAIERAPLTPAAAQTPIQPAGVPAAAAGARGPVDLATLIAVTRSAARITSDYDKSSLLLEIADRFIHDDSLRAAYLQTASTIKSDYERQRALGALLAHDSLSDAMLAPFIRVAGGIGSDYGKAQILSAVAGQYALRGAPLAELVRQAGTISGSMRATVLTSLVGHSTLDREATLAVLGAVKDMSSDADRASVLLAVARIDRLRDPAVRSAFIAAAQSMTSDYYYRQVMSAVASGS